MRRWVVVVFEEEVDVVNGNVRSSMAKDPGS